MDLLDRYADLLEVRAALSERVYNLYALRREMQALTENKEEIELKAERLRYEVDEIDTAELEAGEEEEMTTEYNRLANSESLAETATLAFGLLADEEDDDYVPVVEALQQVITAMTKLVKLDASMQDDYDLAQDTATNAQELSLNLGRYIDNLDYDTVRLNELEERLDLIKRLKKRYHADTVQDLLDHAEKARTELEAIDNSDQRLEQMKKEEDQALRHIGELSERISKIREVAGRALSKKVIRELADLRMEQAKFEVKRTRIEDKKGAYGKDGTRYKFDANGFETVEFLLSANPGEPLRPLAKVASGGEAARIMLALKKVLTQADYTPILIFDEIDTGIGGRLGAVVGEKLWSLTDGHQVLCVTHLPQLASYGDKHFHVTKATSGKRTVSKLTLLDDQETRIAEIAEMLGASGESGLQSAHDILYEADQRKDELVKETELERSRPAF